MMSYASKREILSQSRKRKKEDGGKVHWERPLVGSQAIMLQNVKVCEKFFLLHLF